MHKLINADVLEVLPSLPDFACCFMDPPDALGLSHNGYKERPREGYMDWLAQVLESTIPHCGTTWLSFNAIWDLAVKHWAYEFGTKRPWLEIRPFVWTFTFGQHRNSDCGNGHRPLLRFRKREAPLYPEQIRGTSARLLAGDKRANPAGRVPDDVVHLERGIPDALPLPNWAPRDIERFLSKIIKSDADDCWDWSTSVRGGYGSFSIGSVNYVATRLMWRLVHGTDPLGQLVCHTCDNPRCCNPDHLYLGSYGDNNRDKQAKGRSNCPLGEKHHQAKLTDGDVAYIFQSTANGVTLAKQFGITPANVSAIRRGQTWRHITSQILPSDVFYSPRTVGNSKERRTWHPTQHPEALVERAIKLCTREGDNVLDLFSGTGTVIRVCKRINRHTTSIELNALYCAKIAEEHSLQPVSQDTWA